MWISSKVQLPKEEGIYEIKWSYKKKRVECKMIFNESTKTKWMKYNLLWKKVNE